MGLSLGRIEYRVSVGGTDSYKTTFQLTVMDGELGETDCTFVFNINVEDRAGGPVATIKSATANDVCSSAFPARESRTGDAKSFHPEGEALT